MCFFISLDNFMLIGFAPFLKNKNNLMCLRNLGAGGLLQLDWEVGGTDLILLNLESALLEAWIFIPRQWVGDGEGRWVLGCFEDF